MKSSWQAMASIAFLLNFVLIANAPVHSKTGVSSKKHSSRTHTRAAKTKSKSKVAHRSVSAKKETNGKAIAQCSKKRSKTIATRSHSSKKTAHSTKSSKRNVAYKKGKQTSKRKLYAKRTRKSRTIAHKKKTRSITGLIWTTPVNTTPYNALQRARIKTNFARGDAAKYSPEDLVRGGVVAFEPLKGGIRKRRGEVKHLIIHSTETAKPANAKRIIASWNAGGWRHPGTQYIVDRDGVIYQTANPDYVTMHVNDHRTLRGVNNDNSIGIEIVRTGKEKYTNKQLASLYGLVDYLKDRYNINKTYGHGQIQPSTRTDPVAFDWARFNKNLASLNVTTTKTAFKEANQPSG